MPDNMIVRDRAEGRAEGTFSTAVPLSFKAFRIVRGERVQAGVTNVSLDELTPGEVVVRSAYAGLNYKDALATTDHGNVIRHFPRVGGSDVTGVVVASSDSRFRPGDAVMAYAGGLGVDEDGGFSEYVRLRAERVMPVPSGLNLLEAAALGVAGFTAALAIHLLQENGLKPEPAASWSTAQPAAWEAWQWLCSAGSGIASRQCPARRITMTCYGASVPQK